MYQFLSALKLITLLLLSAAAAQSVFPGTDLPHQSSDSVVSELYRNFNLRRDVAGATILAYLYGYPLTQYAKSRNGTGKDTASANTLTTAGRVARVGDEDVVRPNADTIYGRIYFDLAESNVVITVPPFPQNRYVLFSFFDPFGYSFAGVGSPYPQFQPGKYLLRPALLSGEVGIESCPGYAGCISSPTLDGLVLIRYYVTGESEYPAAVAYLNNTEVTSQKVQWPIGPRLTQSEIDLATLPKDNVVQALTLIARLSKRNPPQYAIFASAMNKIFAEAGIQNGTYTPNGVDTTAVQAYFNGALAAASNDPLRARDIGNDWRLASLSQIGTYDNGTDIFTRSLIAFGGYLANRPEEALYPSTNPRTLKIGKNESLIVRFSGKPNLPENGFWSLTIYDGSGYLFGTPQNVPVLGDRSVNMTFPDGSKVYGPGEQKDGPFEILVQPSNVPPPANWSNNWLPAPVDGGNYQLTLRLFNADASILNGSYAFPSMSKGAAITA